VYREVWQEASAANFDGGATIVVTTGIKVPSAGELSKVRAVLYLKNVTGNPEPTLVAFTLSAGNFLTIQFQNAAVAGNQAAWDLDVQFLHSITQAVDTTYGGFFATVSGVNINPQAGVAELYIDGTNGNDANDGSSWGTAIKSCAQLERDVAKLFSTIPAELSAVVYMRGAFSNENLTLAVPRAFESRLHIGHHLDDWTRVKTGTIVSGVATTAITTMYTFTLAGLALAASDEGALIRITNGVNTMLLHVIHVESPTVCHVNVGASYIPAWLAGGAGAGSAVEILRSGITGLAQVSYAMEGIVLGQQYDCIFGLACQQLRATGACLAACVETTDTGYYSCHSSGTLELAVYKYEYGGVLYSNVAPDVLTLFGMPLAPGEETRYLTGVHLAGQLTVESGDTQVSYGGRILTTHVRSGAYMYLISAKARQLDNQGGKVIVYYTIVTGLKSSFGVSANHFSDTALLGVWFTGLPPEGCSQGLVRVRRGSECKLGSAQGVNSGSGTPLYAVMVSENGMLQFDGDPRADFDGQSGFLQVKDGEVSFTNGFTGRLASTGTDLIIGDGAQVWFGNNISKTVANTGTPFMTVAPGATVVQSAGTCTLPAVADWTAAFGANGALVIDNARVSLGALTGGAGGATGIGCTLRRAATLRHAGAGLTGTAPLKLGVEAAKAWPATAITDRGVVWDDVTQPGLSVNLAPSIRPWILGKFRDNGAGSEGVYLYRIPRVASAPAGTKEAFFQFQLPHTIAPDQAAYFHLHFSAGASGTGNAGTIIDFKAEYTIACPHTGAFPITGFLNLPGTVNGTNYQHDISAEDSIPGNLLGPSACILMRVYRDSAIDTFPSDDAWVISLDWHVPVSREGTATRNGPFPEAVVTDREVCCLFPNV
jgi:hypothetical protein